MNISNHYYIQYMKQAMTNFFFKRKTPTIVSFTFRLYETSLCYSKLRNLFIAKNLKNLNLKFY